VQPEKHRLAHIEDQGQADIGAPPTVEFQIPAVNTLALATIDRLELQLREPAIDRVR